jgi:hypothetical protein
MGFLKRRLERWLDFSERWYPNSILYRIIYLFIMFTVGIFLIMLLYTGHVFGLWEGPLTSEVSDGPIGIIFAIMFIILLTMITWMIIIYWRLIRATKGMELRQLGSRDVMEKVGMDEVLDSRGISYQKDVIDKDNRGSHFHERFYEVRYSFRGYNATILAIRSLQGNNMILIGPIDDLNRSFVRRLQKAIDDDMFSADEPIEGGTDHPDAQEATL